MKRFVLTLAIALMTTITSQSEEKPTTDTRVFEMRTYYAHPGKMKAMHARFRDHTCKLFEKHGITIIGFWTPTDKEKAEEVLVYILAYPSRDAANKSWDAFRKDTDWIKAKADSEKDGPIVKKADSMFLTGTDYSKLK
ncbi:MAG: NIPSNAP family protein [Gemmataceae bacterium]|nr:NIPSNAP family protein [Gemmataceae bacterium]